MKALLRLLVGVAVLLGLPVASAAFAEKPYFQLYGQSGTYTPGTPVRIDFYTNTPVEIDAAVVPVSIAEAVSIKQHGRGDHIDDALFDRHRAVQTARRRIVPPRDTGDHELAFKGFARGLYALRVRARGETLGTALLSITSAGITTTDTGTGVAAYVLDLRTLRARTDVAFDAYPVDSEAPETKRPDASGLVAFDRRAGETGSDTMLIVARTDDGTVALTGGAPHYQSGESTETGLVQTDRPIYRPGHHVMYRAILRDGPAGVLTVPSGTRTVKVKDPSSKAILTVTRTLDAFGTLDGEIQLADDAQLGLYAVTVGDDDHPVYGQFSVEAYKKPEYVVDVAPPANTVGGEVARFGVAARYFFGRPAAGMKLHYRASFRSPYVWWRRGTPFRFAGYNGPGSQDALPQIEGSVTADAAGRAAIAIPTKPVDAERSLELEVDGRDESGRTVTAASASQVTPASLYLTVTPSSYFVNVGASIDFAIRSLSYVPPASPRGSTPVSVAFRRTYWDGSALQRDPTESKDVVTDAAGNASVRWQPSRGGYYEVAATARDERGRDATTVAGVWVPEKQYTNPYAFDRTAVVPQKSAYAPGERPVLLVTTPQADVDALIHVVGGASDRVTVRHLATQTSAIDVDPPAGVARFRVIVTVPSRTGTSSGAAELTVAPPPHKLRVAIRPDKPKYLPGERARFAISVGDQAGKPVRAQIGVAVVDDAIFALRAAPAGDVYTAFYGSAGPYRADTTSWVGLDGPQSAYLYSRLQMIGRTTSREAAAFLPTVTNATDTYSLGAALQQPSFKTLRSDFRDTAYWAPAVVTGNDGRATITFPWPDSLTSYTATGLAVTESSDFGGGMGGALVTKDFLVRLGAPRFLRSGDAAQITGIAQGVRSSKVARLRFSAPLLGVADDTTTARFDANATASARWNVRGHELGESSLRLAGTSGALSDGLRVALPVEASGTPEHERAAGALPAATSLALHLRPGAQAGDLRIDLAPSVLAQLAADVRLLQVYPYYCVEQTMSAALPAIYIDRLRKRIKLPPPDGPAPAEVAKRAVARLVKLQHTDGSWGWWEYDAANPFMSAYALYGLAELAHDGYEVPARTLASGADSVIKQMAAGDTMAFWGGAQPNSEWNTRAFMLYALADAAPKRVDRTVLANTDAHVKDLNSYALSVLGLAHLELDDRAGAQPLLAELLRRVTDEGTFARWKGQGWHYRWQDDPIETTAYALRFVNAMTPDDPHVARAVNWLRSQQHGSWFATTKDTAAAIFAMSEAVPVTSNELDPHETVRVTLDGRILKTVRIEAPVLPRSEASILVPARQLARGGTLRFEREGTGALSWSTDWTQYVRELGPAELDPTFGIERRYSTQSGNEWRVGDRIDVDVTVTPKTDSQFVAIEDPLPAGLEYQPRQHESGDGWSGLQFFDDRVVFFASYVSARSSLHLRYTLRATTAGTFTAPAPTAYAMYGPPTTAAGKPARVTIR
jgi:alpha-2-macroglobulin